MEDIIPKAGNLHFLIPFLLMLNLEANKTEP